MTLALMAYGVVLATLLSGSAYFLDRGIRALGRSTRWIWAAGMAGAAVIPLLARLADQAPVNGRATTVIPVELLYQMLARGEMEAAGSPDLSGTIEPIVLSLWISGSALIVLALLWTSLRLRRAAGTWQRKRLGGQDVLISDGLGPAVLGFLRPTIVLPPWTLAVGKKKLEMILLHEREHQAARDPALLTLALLMVAVAPWNPALWWMARRLHLAVEGDCDGRVLARGIPPEAYGALLLEVASGARGIPALAPALAEGGHTFLERRLLMIRSTVRKHRPGAATLAGLAGVALLALACETPTPPIQMEQESSLDAPSIPTPLAEAAEGYYLVKKTGDEVENLGAVPPEKLKLIREGSEEAPFGLVVRKEGAEGEGVLLRRSPGDAGDTGPKPLIIVDGVIMSDPDFIKTLDPATIDRIEVVKGSAAEALYGDRAAGGVIQVYTKR